MLSPTAVLPDSNNQQQQQGQQQISSASSKLEDHSPIKLSASRQQQFVDDVDHHSPMSLTEPLLNDPQNQVLAFSDQQQQQSIIRQQDAAEQPQSMNNTSTKQQQQDPIRQPPTCWAFSRCFYACTGDFWHDDPTVRNGGYYEDDYFRYGKKRISFPMRMMDSFVVFVFWSSGIYWPNKRGNKKTFSRRIWNFYQNRVMINPKWIPFDNPIQTSSSNTDNNGCEYFDVNVQSAYEANDVRLHCRVHRPSKPKSSSVRLALYFHGGGMVVGDSRIAPIHHCCRVLAEKGDMVVVSVDYRLAPEVCFPSQIFDVFSVFRWIASRPNELKYPTTTNSNAQVKFSKITLIGDSAGGNLALVLATLVRDGLGPDLVPLKEPIPLEIDHLVLLYPMLHLEKFVHHVDGVKPMNMPLLPRPILDFFSTAYAGVESMEEFERMAATDRRLRPTLAGVGRLPHVVLISAGLDCLHHEHLLFLRDLIRENVKLDYHYFEKQPHGFTYLPGRRVRRDECLNMIIKDIQQDEALKAEYAASATVRNAVPYGTTGSLPYLKLDAAPPFVASSAPPVSQATALTANTSNTSPTTSANGSPTHDYPSSVAVTGGTGAHVKQEGVFHDDSVKSTRSSHTSRSSPRVKSKTSDLDLMRLRSFGTQVPAHD